MNNLCTTNITTRWRGLYGIAVLLLWLAGCDSHSEDFNSFQINDPNLKMELVASSPDIQTPIGLAIDNQDDLYILESHTHTPPDNYEGPGFDRIKKGVDNNGDGMPDSWLVFADSLEDGMNLVFGPEQTLFLSTKNEVWAFRDLDGDGVSDRRNLLLEMVEPKSPYDHAAILGVAISPDNNWLFVSRGNTGSNYWVIKGTDGSSISGYGDGGNVMRCRLDGSELEEVATGFWNPFDIKFTIDGRLLLTDNDPDSRGPNRLIEVVPGGDYGYKSIYGGSGLHPYVAWNGELPGTLPYAAPLGEAPCALLDGSLTNFGSDYQNNILVNVWEEKNIVKIPLTSRGSSVYGEPKVLIQGDSTFHPVSLEVNSKGEVYITNWVKRQYPNHGMGEIWRMRSKQPQQVESNYRLDNYRFEGEDFDQTASILSLVTDDPFVKAISRWQLQRDGDFLELVSMLNNTDPELRLQCLVVLSKRSEVLTAKELGPLLSDPDQRVRKMTLIYIGTHQVQGMEKMLMASLGKGEISSNLFETFLATIQNLHPDFAQGYQNKSENKSSSLKRELPDNFIYNIIRDPLIDESIRAQALPYLDNISEEIYILINLLTGAQNEFFQLSLIASIKHAVAMAGKKEVQEALVAVAINENNSSGVRSNAVAAMSSIPLEYCQELLEILPTADSVLQYVVVKQMCNCQGIEVNQWITTNAKDLSAAALSIWTQCNSKEHDAISPEQWANAVNKYGSQERGELVFKALSFQCQTCHQVNGWGGKFGPDLSRIGSSKNQAQLINSVLFPSMEMAPEWQGWYVIDQHGNQHLGRQIDVHLNRVELMNISGSFDSYPKPRTFGVATNSVMPQGLQNGMTTEEFNDLIAFLVSLK